MTTRREVLTEARCHAANAQEHPGEAKTARCFDRPVQKAKL
jgi:hypothetical protein